MLAGPQTPASRNKSSLQSCRVTNMWLKIAIVTVFIALLISLGSAFFFLVQDQGKGKRTLHSLGVRIALAVVLMGLIAYGMLTGQLQSQAPWSAARLHDRHIPENAPEDAEAESPENAPLVAPPNAN
jgi:hypothetical protein